jgi:hypothetical protein
VALLCTFRCAFVAQLYVVYVHLATQQLHFQFHTQVLVLETMVLEPLRPAEQKLARNGELDAID